VSLRGFEDEQEGVLLEGVCDAALHVVAGSDPKPVDEGLEPEMGQSVM